MSIAQFTLKSSFLLCVLVYSRQWFRHRTASSHQGVEHITRHITSPERARTCLEKYV
jgi:hypothetical protein